MLFVKTGMPDEQDKPERYDCFCNHCSLLVVLSSTYVTLQWNLDFSNPPLFEPPDNSSKNPFPFVQSNTVTLPSISRTTRYFKAIFVSLGGLQNRDSTVVLNGFKPGNLFENDFCNRIPQLCHRFH